LTDAIRAHIDALLTAPADAILVAPRGAITGVAASPTVVMTRLEIDAGIATERRAGRADADAVLARLTPSAGVPAPPAVGAVERDVGAEACADPRAEAAVRQVPAADVERPVRVGRAPSAVAGIAPIVNANVIAQVRRAARADARAVLTAASAAADVAAAATIARIGRRVDADAIAAGVETGDAATGAAAALRVLRLPRGTRIGALTDAGRWVLLSAGFTGDGRTGALAGREIELLAVRAGGTHALPLAPDHARGADAIAAGLVGGAAVPAGAAIGLRGVEIGADGDPARFAGRLARRTGLALTVDAVAGPRGRARADVATRAAVVGVGLQIGAGSAATWLPRRAGIAAAAVVGIRANIGAAAIATQ
jgi:hypothetical protein